MGKIIVIEANTDGAGKETQSMLLEERLKKEGKKVFRISFPNYDSDSSFFVKKYLNGDYGKEVLQSNPYVISTFYAIDRYLTYIETIKKYLDEDYIIILDRYVSSNVIYQTSKIYMQMINENKSKEEIKEKIESFIKWEEDLEFKYYNLPKPDVIIYLYIPVEVSQQLIAKRENKINNKSEKDIHEKDIEYLKYSSKLSEVIAEKEKWNKIEVTNQGKIRKREEIAEDLYEAIIGNNT